MLLPVCVDARSASAVLFKEDPPEVLQAVRFRVPYSLHHIEQAITARKLREYLESALKGTDLSQTDKIVIGDMPYISDIAVQVQTELARTAPEFPVMVFDASRDSAERVFVGDALNAYMNEKLTTRHYSFEQILTVYQAQCAQAIRDNLPKFINTHTVVCTCMDDIDAKQLSLLAESLIETSANALPIAGIWSFHFDTTYTFLPVIAGLLHVQSDLKAFFEEHPLHGDAILCVAPEIESLDMKETNGSEFETHQISASEMTRIPMREGISYDIRYKSKRAGYEGKMIGVAQGLFVDTRVRTEEGTP